MTPGRMDGGWRMEGHGSWAAGQLGSWADSIGGEGSIVSLALSHLNREYGDFSALLSHSGNYCYVRDFGGVRHSLIE